MKKKYNLNSLRKKYSWDSLKKVYYNNLSFIDIEFNIKLLERKKKILGKNIKSKEGYSISYSDKKGKLLRLDETGPVPSETYLVWKDELLKEVLTFRRGYFYGKKISKGGELSNYWKYDYKKDKPVKLIYLSLPDNTYYHHGMIKRVCRFVYDSKGLLKVYQTVKGISSVPEKEVIAYERGKKIK